MYAAALQAISKVLLSNNCVGADKATFCPDYCKKWVVDNLDTYENEEVCLEECAKSSDAWAESYVSTLARIDIYNEVECTNAFPAYGNAWVLVANSMVRPNATCACFRVCAIDDCSTSSAAICCAAVAWIFVRPMRSQSIGRTPPALCRA